MIASNETSNMFFLLGGAHKNCSVLHILNKQSLKLGDAMISLNINKLQNEYLDFTAH